MEWMPQHLNINFLSPMQVLLKGIQGSIWTYRHLADTNIFPFSCPGKWIFLASYWFLKHMLTNSNHLDPFLFYIFGDLKLNLELARSVYIVKKLKLSIPFLMLRSNQGGHGFLVLHQSANHSGSLSHLKAWSYWPHHSTKSEPEPRETCRFWARSLKFGKLLRCTGWRACPLTLSMVLAGVQKEVGWLPCLCACVCFPPSFF